MFLFFANFSRFLLIIFFLFSCEASSSDNHSIKPRPSNLRIGMTENFYQDGQRYFIYFPLSAYKNINRSKLLVLVHGYSGRHDNETGRKVVLKTITRWQNEADSNKWILVAPHFDTKRFNSYQTLNMWDDEQADTRLNTLVSIVTERIPGLTTKKFMLFGFSGGGQFAHRYALFNPSRIDKVIVGSPAYYTFPNQNLPYPIGINLSNISSERKIDLQDFLKLKLLVIVGENDSTQSAYVTSWGNYNLNEVQGFGRYSRAMNWYKAILEQDANNKSYKFSSIPYTTHYLGLKYFNTATEFLKNSNQ